mmetsp:Transcript_60861/g.149026  ORF Transcript_60861/g.149026 Transcript_60861/m.149026 type:complete len:200 (+) Transcript_60861:585-1184(+)
MTDFPLLSKDDNIDAICASIVAAFDESTCAWIPESPGACASAVNVVESDDGSSAFLTPLTFFIMLWHLCPGTSMCPTTEPSTVTVWLFCSASINRPRTVGRLSKSTPSDPVRPITTPLSGRENKSGTTDIPACWSLRCPAWPCKALQNETTPSAEASWVLDAWRTVPLFPSSMTATRVAALTVEMAAKARNTNFIIVSK